jgi:hypothetical protein
MSAVLLGFALETIFGGLALLYPDPPPLGYAMVAAPMVVAGWCVCALAWSDWESPAAKTVVASAPAFGLLLLVAVMSDDAVGDFFADLFAGFRSFARECILIAAGPAIVAILSLSAGPVAGQMNTAAKILAGVLMPLAAGTLIAMVGVACREP